MLPAIRTVKPRFQPKTLRRRALAPRFVRLAPAHSETTMDVVIGPVFQILYLILQLYLYVVIVGVILSWLIAFNVVNTSNRFVYMIGDFCYRATEPLLGRIRRFLPNLGGFDLSPIVLIFGIYFLQMVLVNLSRKLV